MLNKKYINKLFAGVLLISLSSFSSVSALAGFNVSGELGLRLQQLELSGQDASQHKAFSLKLDLDQELSDGFRAELGLRTNYDSSKTGYTGFQDFHGRRAINVYKASLEYDVIDSLKLSVGLNSIPLVQYSEFLFDNDLTQPGVFVSYSQAVAPQADLAISAGAITVSDQINTTSTSTGSGEKLFLVQPSIGYELTSHVDLHSYLGLAVSQERPEGKLNVTTYGLKIDFIDPINQPYVEKITLAYEGSDNSDANEKGGANSVSLSIGSKEINSAGDFTFAITMDEIQLNAFDSAYLNDQRFGGQAGIKGSRYTVNAGVTNSIFASFNYYDYELLANSSTTQKNMTLALVTKF